MKLSFDVQDVGRRIHELVWGGFHADDDIDWIITDEYLDPSELNDEDVAWVKTEVERVCELKHAAEATWPAQTEFDRLEAVFAQLRTQKFIALHRAGNTLSDGKSDAKEAWQIAGGPTSGLQGYCFYHSQDVDGAVSTGKLHIASGGIGATEQERAAGLGALTQNLMALLREAGFGVNWSGDVAKRLEVDLGQWRKRSSRR